MQELTLQNYRWVQDTNSPALSVLQIPGRRKNTPYSQVSRTKSLKSSTIMSGVTNLASPLSRLASPQTAKAGTLRLQDQLLMDSINTFAEVKNQQLKQAYAQIQMAETKSEAKGQNLKKITGQSPKFQTKNMRKSMSAYKHSGLRQIIGIEACPLPGYEEACVEKLMIDAEKNRKWLVNGGASLQLQKQVSQRLERKDREDFIKQLNLDKNFTLVRTVPENYAQQNSVQHNALVKQEESPQQEGTYQQQQQPQNFKSAIILHKQFEDVQEEQDLPNHSRNQHKAKSAHNAQRKIIIKEGQNKLVKSQTTYMEQSKKFFSSLNDSVKQDYTPQSGNAFLQQLLIRQKIKDLSGDGSSTNKNRLAESKKTNLASGDKGVVDSHDWLRMREEVEKVCEKKQGFLRELYSRQSFHSRGQSAATCAEQESEDVIRATPAHNSYTPISQQSTEKERDLFKKASERFKANDQPIPENLVVNESLAERLTNSEQFKALSERLQAMRSAEFEEHLKEKMDSRDTNTTSVHKRNSQEKQKRTYPENMFYTPHAQSVQSEGNPLAHPLNNAICKIQMRKIKQKIQDGEKEKFQIYYSEIQDKLTTMMHIRLHGQSQTEAENMQLVSQVAYQPICLTNHPNSTMKRLLDAHQEESDQKLIAQRYQSLSLEQKINEDQRNKREIDQAEIAKEEYRAKAQFKYREELAQQYALYQKQRKNAQLIGGLANKQRMANIMNNLTKISSSEKLALIQKYQQPNSGEAANNNQGQQLKLEENQYETEKRLRLNRAKQCCLLEVFRYIRLHLTINDVRRGWIFIPIIQNLFAISKSNEYFTHLLLNIF